MGKRLFTLLAAALAVLAVAVSGSATPTGGPPSIAGEARVGAQLTFTPGAYAPGEGGGAVTQSHVWQLCNDAAGNGCANVQDLGANYTTPADVANVGKFVRALETASDGVDPPHVVPSNAVGPLAGLPPVAPPGGVPAPTGKKTPTDARTTLTAHTGAVADWQGVPPPNQFTYQWICNPGCDTPAAESTLVGPPTGPNATFKVVVTGSNGYGTPASVESPEVRLPFVAAPNLVVGGAPVTVTPGAWPGFNPPTDHWQRCAAPDGNSCGDIGFAGAAYALQPADAGQFLRVSERTTNGSLNSDAVSNLVGPVNLAPLNTGVDGMVFPFVSDGNDEIPMRGETLTGSSGIWFAFPAPAILHKWQRCPLGGNLGACVDIAPPIPVQQVFTPDGQPVYAHTGISQYVVTDLDLGSLIRVVPVVANGIGDPVELPSLPSVPVQGAPLNRTDLGGGNAGLAGQAARGQTLTATSGAWTGFWVAGLPPLHITHHWERLTPDGGAVDLGTVETPLSPAGVVACTEFLPCSSGSVYTLGDADLGSRIRVTITVSNGGGPVALTLTSDVAVGSPVIPLVDGQPNPNLLPEVVGGVRQGFTVVATTGTWTAFPSDNLTHEFQWLRCAGTGIDSCTPIAGATADIYKLTAADVFKRVRVRVTARNGVAPPGIATSAPTLNVGQAPGGGGGGGGGGNGADLLVQLSISSAGTETRYTTTVRNVGNAGASGVRLNVVLPPQLALVSATPSQGSCGGAVACSLGSIGAGGQATVTIVVKSNESGTFPLSVSVTSDTPDVNPTNNSFTTFAFGSQTGAGPSATAAGQVAGSGAAKAGPKVAKVPPTLKAMKVKKTWVVETKFSLLEAGGKLELTVTKDTLLQKLPFLKGSRLGPVKAKKPTTRLLFNAKKPGSFPIKIILPAKGFKLLERYVIRLTATGANGEATTLDLGFRGSKLIKKKTAVKYGGTNLVAASRFLVPKDKAKIGVKSWLTKGKGKAQLRVLKGSRLGKSVAKSARRQLAYKATKRGRYIVKMILPVKGFSGKLWYRIHVDSRPKNAAWTTTQIRFKASKTLLKRLSRAVASANAKKAAGTAKAGAPKKGVTKKAKK